MPRLLHTNLQSNRIGGRYGGEGNRTPDLLNAIQALSQLSYTPLPTTDNTSHRNLMYTGARYGCLLPPWVYVPSAVPGVRAFFLVFCVLCVAGGALRLLLAELRTISVGRREVKKRPLAIRATAGNLQRPQREISFMFRVSQIASNTRFDTT